MPQPEDQNLNNFSLFIQQLEKGALHDELSENIKKCVKEIADACCDRGGKHKATLTLKVDFVMNQQDKFVEVTADVKTKVPEAPRGRGGIFFAHDDGSLTRQDPNQRTFDEVMTKRLAKNN